MGLWNFYFFSKYYLFLRGLIQIDFIFNLIFFVFLIIPIPEGARFYRLLKGVKLALGLILSILLLWHDSWLPSFHKTISFILDEGLPLKEYMIQFSQSYFSGLEFAVIGAIFFVCYFAYRKEIRLTPVAFILLLLIPVQNYRNEPTGEIGRTAARFFKNESKKVTHFVRPREEIQGFDVIILHVCSLSWDDLKELRMEKDPFFNQFDFLLTRFNGVTSYSGPAAIRLLRGTCGQTQHSQLYRDVSDECYLFSQLSSIDYQNQSLLNHDGIYGHFSYEIQKFGRLNSPIIPRELPVQSYNFDGSAIYDDYWVLKNWWNSQNFNSSQKIALYYNTISLHEGTHLYGEKEWWKNDRKERYRASVVKLFSDFSTFFRLIESSGRKAIVLFIPEHGMALRGSPIQVAGLREIPLPEITRVPVGIKFVGFENFKPANPPTVVSKQLSYFSLSFILSQLFQSQSYEVNNLFLQDLMGRLPETEFVSENSEAEIVQNAGRYYLYAKEKEWKQLTTEKVN